MVKSDSTKRIWKKPIWQNIQISGGSSKAQKGDVGTIRNNLKTTKAERDILNQVMHDDKVILPNYDTKNKNKYDPELQKKVDEICEKYEFDIKKYQIMFLVSLVDQIMFLVSSTSKDGVEYDFIQSK